MKDLTPVFRDLAAAQAALRDSVGAFDDMIASMHCILIACATAINAQRQAVDAVIAATEAALRLIEGEHQ